MSRPTRRQRPRGRWFAYAGILAVTLVVFGPIIIILMMFVLAVVEAL